MTTYPLEAFVHFVEWNAMIREIQESELLKGAVHLSGDSAFVVDGAPVEGRKINDRHSAQRRRG
jgi:hypothetical protein